MSGLKDIQQGVQPYGWFVFRAVVGIMFLMHGAQKLFGFMGKDPQSFTGGMGLFGMDIGINMLWVAGFIEFFGGLLVLIGLWASWAAIANILLMVMAYLHAHTPMLNAEVPSWINPLANGGENAILYLVAFIVIFAYGAGKWSVDEMLQKR